MYVFCLRLHGCTHLVLVFGVVNLQLAYNNFVWIYYIVLCILAMYFVQALCC